MHIMKTDYVAGRDGKPVLAVFSDTRPYLRAIITPNDNGTYDASGEVEIGGVWEHSSVIATQVKFTAEACAQAGAWVQWVE